MSTLESVLAAAMVAAAPVVFAALGVLVTERAGVLNLGVEGIMLLGAVSGFAAARWTESAWPGVAMASVVGAAAAALFAAFTVTLRANQVVCGLAFAIGGASLAAFLGKSYIGQPPGASFDRHDLSPLSDLPLVGPMLFHQDMLVYLAGAAAIACHWWLTRTRPGLLLRAVGDDPGAVDAIGVSVPALRYAHVIVGGALMGVGGAYLSLAYTPSWIENMTAGRGWIAIALVIFAAWRPVWVLGGAVLFGAAEALGPRLQVIDVPVNSYLLEMLPYLLTLGALCVTSVGRVRRRLAVPVGLGLPYDREER